MGDPVTEQAGTEATTSATDYQLIGGAPAVSTVVNRFYELILTDTQLAPFFTDVDMARLKRHQVLLISQVLGGPAEYDGRELREAHAGMNITTADFARVVTHLVTALEEAGVKPDIIDRVCAVLAGAEKDVVTASNA
ncbi:group 1 truncated hemoglobin [Actinopolymorpha sp. B11F2]|uniref:group I truncated hemoglobin n=1 Tax=Actinopolymorpha sp. B11F2 TaxID=3160862 RepID=UPI0032E3FADB